MRITATLLFSIIVFHLQTFAQSSPATSSKIIDIDINKALKIRKEFKLSQIVKDVDFIFLEDNVKCSMVGMTEFTMGKSYIMAGYGAMGPNTTHLVHIFDRTGKYLRSLGSEGKGPGEYLNIFRAAMDPLERFVIIVDLQQGKLIKFDVNGKFLLEKKYSGDMPATSFPTLIRFDETGQIYLYCQRPVNPVNGYYSIVCYDQDLHPRKAIFPRKNNEDLAMTVKHNQFSWDRDHFVFWETFFDTVYYCYPDKSPIPKFHIAINSGGWPKEMLKGNLGNRQKTNEFITMTNILDLPDFLIIDIRDKYWYSVCYNKNSGESFSMTKPDICLKPKEKFIEGHVNNDLIGIENIGLGEYLPDQNLMVGGLLLCCGISFKRIIASVKNV